MFNLHLQFAELNYPKKLKRKLRRFFQIAIECPVLLKGTRNLLDALEETAVVFEHELYMYYLNCRSRGKWWGNAIVKYKNIGKYKDESMPQYLRDIRPGLPCVRNAGWHFSYLGGADKIKNKLAAIIDSNPEIIKKMGDYATDAEHIDECLRKGIDLYGRSGDVFEYEFVSINDIGINKVEQLVAKYPTFFKM